jgi:benzoyl-CoA reductase subunit D
MITAGIDSGSRNTKAVVLEDGRILGKAKSPTEFSAALAARTVYAAALADAGVSADRVRAVWATGTGRAMVDFADGGINEVSAAARGAHAAAPETELVIDMGAESSRAVRLLKGGAIRNYEINDKCASGAGTFIESMARTLEIGAEEMGAYSLRHTKDVPMNAQCVVFAESEVISLIHRRERVEDIAHGIHVGIANRVSSLVRRVGVTDNIILIGGPAYNAGLVVCLSNELGKTVAVPENAEYISALGAAVRAAEKSEQGSGADI